MFNNNRSKITLIILFLGHYAKLGNTSLPDNLNSVLTTDEQLMSKVYNTIIKYLSGNISAEETEQLCDLLFEHAPIIFSNVIFEGKKLSDTQGRQRTKMLLLDGRFSLKLKSDLVEYITDLDLFPKLSPEFFDESTLEIIVQKKLHSNKLLRVIAEIFYNMVQVLGGRVYSETFKPDITKCLKMFNDETAKFVAGSGMTLAPLQAFAHGQHDEDAFKKIAQKAPEFFTDENKQYNQKRYIEVCRGIQNFVSQAYNELQKLELLENNNNSHFASELIKILPFETSIKTKYKDLGPKKGLETVTTVRVLPSQVAKYVDYFSKLSSCNVAFASENVIVIHETGNQSKLDEFIAAKKSIIKDLLSFVKNKPIDIMLPKTELEADDSNQTVVGHP